MRWVRFFSCLLSIHFPGRGELLGAEDRYAAVPSHYFQPRREEHFQVRSTRWLHSASCSVRPRRVSVKSWLLLGMVWEGWGLRRLGRNLRPCFFPAQPFLVDRAVRESHECLASAPLYVFPAFVIGLFLSTSGFFKHAT